MKGYALRDILVRKKDVISVEDDTEYKRITIRMNGNGVLLRDEVLGEAIGTKRQFIIGADQFVLSKIDARNGAFGIVPKSCDGAIITGNFWVFDVNSEIADIKYLDFMSKTPAFREFCVVASEGTTNRKYLDEEKFLNKGVVLPEISEQRGVVAKILKLKNKIELARKLRAEIIGDLQTLLTSAFHKIIEGADYRPMAEVAPIVKREVEINFDDDYPELGVRSFGKGVFHKPTLKGVDLPEWQKFYRIEKDDLIFNVRKSWEGSIGVASDEDHGRVASHNSYLTCIPVEGVVTSQFLCFYFLSKEGLMQIDSGSRGSADRNRVISMGRLNKFTVPVPSYDKQLWFNQLQSYVAKIKQAQSENEIELEALMPSVLDKAFKGELV